MKVARKVFLSALALSVLVAGCGSGGPNPFDSSQPRFINLTDHPGAEVFPIWESEISNAVSWLCYGYHGVARAPVLDLDGNVVSTPTPQLCAQVQQIAANLRGITVKSQADVPATVINAGPVCQHCPYADPTGFILCPPNDRGEVYCDAYNESLLVFVVPESKPEYFGPWEIMTTLLRLCGKDTSNMSERPQASQR